tara:strand:- start:192 stop:377 length:186 start_codon:yes stop_codon:yes gene_type:complete
MCAWQPLPKPERGLTKEVMAAYQVEIDRLEALKAAALYAMPPSGLLLQLPTSSRLRRSICP